ncbi:MAG: TRAP transporter small permease subunit [Pseudomonadota bacterium]
MIRFKTVERGVERCAGALAVLGGLGLLFATAITCVSILLRLLSRLLQQLGTGLADDRIRPILGEEELVSYGVGLALFAALPWVMVRRGHIRVDLFKPLYGDQMNRVLDLLADCALAVIGYLIMTRQWSLIFSKPRSGEDPVRTLLRDGDLGAIAERLRTAQESQILAIPLWPTYVLAELCVVAFVAVACFCVLRSARAVIRTDG